jgi:hypothetical protein
MAHSEGTPSPSFRPLTWRGGAAALRCTWLVTLLLTAASCGSGNAVEETAPTQAAPEPSPPHVDPLDVAATPPESALALFGGQTGSESTGDSSHPCDADAGVEPDPFAIVEAVSGKWQLQVNGAEATEFELTLDTPVVAPCMGRLHFEAMATFNSTGGGWSRVQLPIQFVVDDNDNFSALVEFETQGAMGVRTGASELLQVLLVHDGEASAGWVQAAATADRSKRRTLAVMQRVEP